MRRSARTSRSTLSAERDWMTRPSCSVMRAEGAAAEAAAHRDDRVLHRLERGDLSLVREVRRAREGQVVERVHLGVSSGTAGGLKYTACVAVRLQQRAPVAGVGLVLERARHLGEGHLVAAHLLVRRQPERPCRRSRSGSSRQGAPTRPCCSTCAVPRTSRSSSIGSPAASRRRPPTRAARPCRRSAGRPWRRAGRAPDRVAPVVVVRDAPQRRLDAAEHDGHAREGLPREVRVHDGRAVGPQARAPPGEYWSSAAPSSAR
jgi:hypothetical protein